MASRDDGKPSQPDISQPRPASARRWRIGENSASSGASTHTNAGGGRRQQSQGCFHGEHIWQVRGQGHPQARLAKTCRVPGAAYPVIEQRQQGLGLLQQHGACCGEPDSVPPTLNQPVPDQLFQAPYLLAQRRLGDEHPLRGVRERARVGNRHEVAQVAQLHAVRRHAVGIGQDGRSRLRLLHSRHRSRPGPSAPHRAGASVSRGWRPVLVTLPFFE
jgi:hypothetical protein